MTAGQHELLNLIRISLWSDTEWPHPAPAVLSEARKQAVVPLIAPNSPEATQHTAHYLRILYAQDALAALFAEAGIPMVILKGSAAAIYYPEPVLRTMGDIDLIVPQEMFDGAVALMAHAGYKKEAGESAKPDARHVVFVKDEITFELHHHFSSEGIDIEKYVTRGLASPVMADLAGHSFSMLPALENGIMLLAHVAQHLRNELGLRQMIDWMMYVHAVLTDEFWYSEFQSTAADCGLETLAITATRLCQKHLGLPDVLTWCSGADEELVDALLDNLLVTGNFGHSHGSGSSVETVATNIKRKGLFRYLQQQGERNWQTYQNHKILKPFCWLYQSFRYIRRGFKTGRSCAQLAQDYSRSRSRYDLLTRLGID